MSDLFGGKYNLNLGDKYGFNTSTLVDTFQEQIKKMSLHLKRKKEWVLLIF